MILDKFNLLRNDVNGGVSEGRDSTSLLLLFVNPRSDALLRAGICLFEAPIVIYLSLSDLRPQERRKSELPSRKIIQERHLETCRRLTEAS